MFKTTKAKVIFVVLFSIICIITTALLILYKNIDIEQNEQDIQQENPKENLGSDVSGIDLNGKYNQNDLNVEEKKVTLEKTEISYLQINGLKDKTIENKINKEIETLALNWYKEEIKDLGEVINISVTMWETASFANTISFELSYTAKIDDDDDGLYYGVKGLNYDLNTGEKITIDKIFTDNAPIENILRQSAYYSLVSCTVEDNLAGDLIVTDYGDIEDNIVEIINLYKNGKITEFTYTPTGVSLLYKGNQMLYIDMEDFTEYIAIYNRYLTDESIYESNDIGIKNLYTLTRRYNDIYYYTNYQNEDNYFIDISIDFQTTQDDEFAKELVQEKILEIEKEIEKVKQKVKENPNEFYILNYYISVYTGEDWATKQVLTNYYERGNSYYMTVHDFEENIEPIIIEYNRQNENGGIPDYVYDFTELLDIEPQNNSECYNPETGDKIVI